jgi:hypothetical protein
MLPRFDQITQNDSKNSPQSYQKNQIGQYNLKDSPSPIADDEQSAACTNLTQDFKIKMNRVVMGASVENEADENEIKRRQTDMILHHNLFDLVSHENVKFSNFDDLELQEAKARYTDPKVMPKIF